MAIRDHIIDASNLITLAGWSDQHADLASIRERLDKAASALDDALAMLDDTDDTEHPGCLACGRNEWGYGENGAYCHRHQ